MTELAEPHNKPLRTWRPMVLWTAGILLALGLAWFIGAVAVPVWRARVAIAAYCERQLPCSELLKRMGGEAALARKLALYRRMPTWVAPHKYDPNCIRLFGACGRHGMPHLIAVVRGERGPARLGAIKALAYELPPSVEAAPALAEALEEDWEPVHIYALVALERIGPAAGCAVQALEREMVTGNRASCPVEAAWALWSIAPDRLVDPLQDPDPAIRVRTVWRIKDVTTLSKNKRALEVLQAAAVGRDPVVRSAAAEALKKIRNEETGP